MSQQPAEESTGRLWLLAAGYVAGLVLLQQLSLLLTPVPVAVYAARRRMGTAWFFVVAALAAGLLSSAFGMVPLGFPNVLFAMTGFVLGWGIRSERAYRHVVAFTAIVLFVMFVVVLSAQWDSFEVSVSDALVKVDTQLEGSESAELSESSLANLNMLKWFLEHCWYVMFGNAFAVILAAMCFASTLVYQWLRRYREIRLVGSFREFKPPDALVWVAIVAAVLWLANDRWPQETFQFWSWNLAVGVFVWYWLNGLSLMLYTFAAVKPHPAVAMLFVVFLLFVGIMILAVAGMFDTWGDFRKTIDSRVAARKSGGGTA